jgi:hypothetical protein
MVTKDVSEVSDHEAARRIALILTGKAKLLKAPP